MFVKGHRRVDPPVVRFWRMVYKTDTCWLWTGTATDKGYGQFWDGVQRQGAYRYSYELEKGLIPEDWVIDHLCRNPRCVRPSHLEAVSQAENIRRGKVHAAIELAVAAGLGSYEEVERAIKAVEKNWILVDERKTQ